MASFKDAIPVILEHEGGFSNDPDDPGGATNWGISLRFLRTLPLSVGDIDGDVDVDVDDIRNMPKRHAISIYRQLWNKQLYMKVRDQDSATKIFDLSINMGIRRVRNNVVVGGAHIIAQRAVRAALGTELVEDGLIGPITVRAINNSDPNKYISAIKSEAAGYYRSLNKSKYIKGWLNRAYS